MLTLISAHFPIQAKQPARSVEVCQFRKLRDLQTQCAEGFAARRSLCTCKFLQLSGSCKCTQARAPSMQPGHRSRTACTFTEANTGKGRPGMGRLRLLVILSLNLSGALLHIHTCRGGALQCAIASIQSRSQLLP